MSRQLPALPSRPAAVIHSSLAGFFVMPATKAKYFCTINVIMPFTTNNACGCQPYKSAIKPGET